VIDGGFTVAALAAVMQPVARGRGRPVVLGAPFEQNGEFGGHGFAGKPLAAAAPPPIACG
jgi:hypothetical protein